MKNISTALIIESDASLRTLLVAAVEAKRMSLVLADSEREAWLQLLKLESDKRIDCIVFNSSSELVLTEQFWERIINYCQRVFHQTPKIMNLGAQRTEAISPSLFL